MELDIKLSSTVYYDKIDRVTNARLLHNETPWVTVAKEAGISGAVILHVRYFPVQYVVDSLCQRNVQMQMRFRGGYNISLQGRPDGAIKVMPKPDVLYLPLCSQRFAFNELNVKDGQKVNDGDVLAKDMDNYAVPLLAPRAGTIRLKPAENHMFRRYLL